MMKRVGTWRAAAIVMLGGLASGGCFAQSATDCSSVADDKSRLKCYDEQAHRQAPKAVAPAASASSAAPAQAASAAHVPSPPPAAASSKPAAAASDFGLGEEAVRRKREAEQPSAPKESDQLVARVKAVTTKARGEFRITTEEGQVWEETEHTPDTIAPAVGESVTIKRGMMGSYFLTRKSAPAARVKRIE